METEFIEENNLNLCYRMDVLYVFRIKYRSQTHVKKQSIAFYKINFINNTNSR